MSIRRVAGLALRASVPLAAAGLLAAVAVQPQVVRAVTGDSVDRAIGRAAEARPASRAVPVTTSKLVCPGPETIGVRDAASSAPRTPPAPVRVDAASAPSELRPTGTSSSDTGSASSGSIAVRAGGSKTIAASDGAASVGAVADTAVSPVVVGTGSAAPGLVAEQRSVVYSADLRGLSSATCLAPQDDQWLVGGGSEVGRRGRLVLTNPQASSVEVTVDVLTAKGTIERTTGSTVALAAFSRTVLLLGALAPGAQAPVVRVRSTGGAIGAVLADAWLEGTTPRGTDDVVAAAPPATSVLVPGVRIRGSAAVRIAVPGSAEAVTQVRLIGEKGAVALPGDGVVRVPAGSSRDVDLSGVPAGAYAVEVTADVPVVAGALVQRRANPSGPGEIAWSASSRPIGSLAGVAGIDLGAGWRTDLVLTAPRGGATAQLTTRRPDGSMVPSTVQVAGGTTTVVPVDGTAVWVRPVGAGGPLVAARFVTRETALGDLITTGPLRQVALTRVPVVVSPAPG